MGPGSSEDDSRGHADRRDRPEELPQPCSGAVRIFRFPLSGADGRVRPRAGGASAAPRTSLRVRRSSRLVPQPATSSTALDVEPDGRPDHEGPARGAGGGSRSCTGTPLGDCVPRPDSPPLNSSARRRPPASSPRPRSARTPAGPTPGRLRRLGAWVGERLTARPLTRRTWCPRPRSSAAPRRRRAMLPARPVPSGRPTTRIQA